MTKDDLLLLFKSEICDRVDIIDSEFEELDWYDMSIGFFLAKGASIELAGECAVEARYTHQYWC